ncbi:hypothetical protein MMJ09_27710, partial [Bacillus vallismortis]|nr:hypothetical protein [Bacillus vallismortis]
NTISFEIFKEQHDILIDLSAIINDFYNILHKSKRIDLNNVQDVDLLLFEFHKMSTLLEWLIPEISDLNIRLLKKNM